MDTADIYEWAQNDTRAVRRAAIPLLIAMMVGIYFLVYYTGGSKYVFSHSMYIPIILAGLIFGIRGGLVVGALGGFILGPFMPINVITGEPQDTVNWLFRACFFIIIGILIGAASDSTKEYMDRIKWMMSHDVSSGLPNRQALIDAMKNVYQAGETQKNKGLAIVSIDNAFEIESAYGPERIDKIIAELVSRCHLALQIQVVIYRINTHQLGILLLTNGDDVHKNMLDRLTDISKHPFAIGDVSIHGDIRIGYAPLMNRQEEPENYLRKAEIALRTASEQSQNWVFFTPELESKATKANLRLLSELKEALECGQLSMHYQPKVNIASGNIQGVEALMRWQHPKLGLIKPDNFIPRAEKSVLIDEVTEWAINTALAQHVAWKKKGLELPVSVNISPKNLLQPGFVDIVLRLLDYHQVKGKFLELEVTENAVMLDIERIMVKLIELSDINVIISIDDFGTGYSSLQYLDYLPATTIKIDHSFIQKLSTDAGSNHIVSAAVNLAHGLKKNAVAEGVEDKSAYDFLAYIGCDTAQGYYISQALPGKEVLDWCHDEQQAVLA
jgi:diguanylate cyclase (GGDEF)-like protein